ncbi:MAG: HAMP domain-containing protein, partial [Actinomycetes bacterium]
MSTLLLAAVVVSLVGWVLLSQITDGLVDSKTDSSVAEAVRGTIEAQERLSAASSTDFDSSTQLGQLVEILVSRGDVQGFEVLLAGPVAGTSEGLATGSGTRGTPGLDISSVPVRLQEVVEQGPGTSWTYAPISYVNDPDKPTVPGVIAGSQITLPSDGGTYALYYLFPMNEERDTLSLVRRALFTGGALLMVLVGALTWLVTRQVVTPVRLARRVAERLSSGRLEERMHVRGDDDIARLGTSFN